VAAGTATSEEPADFPVSTSPEGTYSEANVLGFLSADGRFGTFIGILERHEPGRFMPELTKESWPHTLLAPTDAAFEGLPPELVGHRCPSDSATPTICAASSPTPA
jgi:uncharacterized surface protein with fasciclin (FAS1) repeats